MRAAQRLELKSAKAKNGPATYGGGEGRAELRVLKPQALTEHRSHPLADHGGRSTVVEGEG